MRARRAGRAPWSRAPSAGPAAVSPMRMHSASSEASTLPPESTAQVSPSAAGATLPCSRAATPTAPAPSTTSFERSSSSTIASATSSSVTLTISSTWRSSSGPVTAPGFLTAMPSQMVLTGLLRADADHPRLRTGDRDPRDQPAAAERHHDQPHVRRLARDLHAHAALSGHHGGIVERRDQLPALLLRHVCGRRHRVLEAALDQTDLAAVLAHRLHLRHRRARRHHEHRVVPALPAAYATA